MLFFIFFANNNVFPKSFLGGKQISEKNVEKKILEAVNQRKKTSDCIKIDPPGPGRNFKKTQKRENKFSKKKKTVFLEAIYQLKNTSDCIQIDPPGPGQNLKNDIFRIFFPMILKMM